MFLPLFIVLPGFERTQRSFVTTLLISRFVAINKPKEMQFLIQIKEKVVLGNCLFYLDLKNYCYHENTQKSRRVFIEGSKVFNLSTRISLACQLKIISKATCDTVDILAS